MNIIDNRQMRLVVKDNALINASYSLSSVEQKLILLAASENHRKNIQEQKRFKIHASVYAEQFNISENIAYKRLKEASETLFERQFSYIEKLDNGKLRKAKSRWVQEIAYYPGTGYIDIIFSEAVIPMISMLEKHFTSYDLQQVAGLTSKYAIRLYELIVSWRASNKTPVYEIHDLREKLGVEDAYPQTAEFRRNVINVALRQINEETDLTVKVHQHKTGRTITGYSFSFKEKTTVSIEQPDESRDTDTVDMFSGFTDKQLDFYVSQLIEYPEIGTIAPIGKNRDDVLLWLRSVLVSGFDITKRDYLLNLLRKNDIRIYGLD